MSWVIQFWRQPCKPYRNFQLIFLPVTLNFILPALIYTFDPGRAIDSFVQMNTQLGGIPYPFMEIESHLWRYLAAANVMTLGFMCLVLQINLRRFYPVLVPLTFMKGYAAACWFGGWVGNLDIPVFLAAAILDGFMCFLFVFFARRARQAIQWVDNQVLVPQPRWLETEDERS